MEDSGALRGFDWEGAKDITALSEGDLRGVLRVLTREERAVSYRLCILRGRMDLVRAQLAGRGLASPEDLARVLLGDFPEERA